MCHVGLTPQSSAAMGGFRAQGRTTESARAVIQDAIAVYKAGARCLLLEGIPEEVGAFIHKNLPIPVYGIGAGSERTDRFWLLVMHWGCLKHLNRSLLRSMRILPVLQPKASFNSSKKQKKELSLRRNITIAFLAM